MLGSGFSLEKFIDDNRLYGLLATEHSPNIFEFHRFNRIHGLSKNQSGAHLRGDEVMVSGRVGKETSRIENVMRNGLINIDQAYMLIQFILRSKGFRVYSDVEIQNYFEY